MLNGFLKGLTDDELPMPELNGHRRNIGWSEAREAAVIKWQTESCFQEQALKKLFRVVKKVESLFPEEARNRRMRLFKTLRLGEKYSAMEDVLVKNRSTPTYLSYFQPQLIGEHYINGEFFCLLEFMQHCHNLSVFCLRKEINKIPNFQQKLSTYLLFLR